MSNIIIFGNRDFAELADYYITTDTDHKVAAFCVSSQYLKDDSFKGKPVIAFEEILSNFSPKDYKFFAPMSPSGMNTKRADIFNGIKKKGYSFISYVSSKAMTFNSVIGENCLILENNTIQPFSSIGNNVILWSGNHIGHHGFVGDHVFFASQIVMSGHCRVDPFCYLGVNSSLKNGIVLAEGTLVGMGAVILEDTEKWSIYTGNPAVKRKMSSTEANI